MKDSILFDKSCELCGDVFDICEALMKIGKKNISNQLERCSTSIAANLSEAGSAESSKDFVHKLKLASKESNETLFWLKLVERKKIIEIEKSTFNLLTEVQKMLSKSIATAIKNDIERKNKRNPPPNNPN